jgi:Na+-transporting methylmalonyl-CoA/oxaloacetate decarboxylase gamma subunit
MNAQQIIIAVSLAGAAKGPALTAESSWGDVFGFLCLGMFIVLATLAVLSMFCAVIGFFFKRIEAVKQSRDDVKMPQEIAPPIADTPHLPVIAAAVAIVLDNHHYRITRITPARGSWALEGRRQIFASHIFAKR